MLFLSVYLVLWGFVMPKTGFFLVGNTSSGDASAYCWKSYKSRFL